MFCILSRRLHDEPPSPPHQREDITREDITDGAAVCLRHVFASCVLVLARFGRLGNVLFVVSFRLIKHLCLSNICWCFIVFYMVLFSYFLALFGAARSATPSPPPLNCRIWRAWVMPGCPGHHGRDPDGRYPGNQVRHWVSTRAAAQPTSCVRARHT